MQERGDFGLSRKVRRRFHAADGEQLVDQAAKSD